MNFPVPIGKQTMSHCTLSWSVSGNKVYQWSFCQIKQLCQDNGGAYKVFWNYSATNHGKGAVDSVGGTTKQVATQAVVTTKAIIKDAVSMFNAVNEKAKLTQEHIESTLWDLGMHILWQDINALPGTIHIQQVEQTDEGKVSTHMFYSDWCRTIHLLNSVELPVIDKHQDTTWFPPPIKLRGFLVFEIWTKRGIMKKLLRNRGVSWKGVIIERGGFPNCFISFP